MNGRRVKQLKAEALEKWRKLPRDKRDEYVDFREFWREFKRKYKDARG